MTDYEDRRYKSDTVITGVFPGSEIVASLLPTGETRNNDGVVIWGKSYEIDVHVSSDSIIKGSAKLTSVTLLETDTGNVIYQTDTTFIQAFIADDYYGGSRALIPIPKFKTPYTDCTLHFDLVAEGPWGIKKATIEIPFEWGFETSFA